MDKIKGIFVVILAIFALLFIFGCTQVDQTELPGDDDFGIVDDTGPGMIDTIGDDPIVIDEGLLNVVVTVNGEDILREEVLSLQQMFAQQGQQVSEQEILEQLINQKVIHQQAISQGFDITDEAAEMEITAQLAQQGATLEDFKEQLELQGVSYSDQLDSIKKQISIENYLFSQIGDNQIDISAEEVQEFYDEYVLGSGDEETTFEEVEMQIRMILQQDKELEIIEDLVQELVSNAIIEYN